MTTHLWIRPSACIWLFATVGLSWLSLSAIAHSAERFPSPVPRQSFSQTLAEQEKELKTNALMLRFAESRKKLAADRYRPAYHFVSPESQLNDPNGLCFWQGRWHLFYQGYPPDEFPEPAGIPSRRQHWGHAVSDDLVRWRDLPYAIYPGIERMCFSGSTVVEEKRVVAFYPGIAAGQMVAVSKDPLLLNWEKIGGNPVRSPAGDSCIWKEGDTYFGLVGADCLVSSKDLSTWAVHGAFLEGNPFPLGDAGACPNFVPIGNKHLLLSFSHTTGGQYLLGDYDRQRHRFKPYAHGRFNHGTVSPGGVHAPSAAADGKGGVVNILNINDGKPSPEWDQIMSLAQHLTLGPDSQLRIAPVEAIATLRAGHEHVGETVLPANKEIVLESIKGNTLELDAAIDPKESRWVQLNVLRSPNAEEQTSITFYNFDRKLSIWYHTQGVVCLDGSRSSTLPDVWPRPPERAVMKRGAETLKLRVFVDRSVVEVFVNGKLYLAMRVYSGRRDSLGVSLRAQGQDAVLKSLDAWQVQSIWP
jgi:beta-fructofuranosidase